MEASVVGGRHISTCALKDTETLERAQCRMQYGEAYNPVASLLVGNVFDLEGGGPGDYAGHCDEEGGN